MIYYPEIGKHAELLRQRGFEDLRQKRLIFTISTGRTATQTLSALFGCAPGTFGVHEPDPAWSKCLRRVQRNSEAALEFLLDEKLAAIRSAAETCYVETSHLVCKGFIEPILELGLTPHFLIVRRDPRAVARSFLELDSVPERTALGRDYMVSPADPCLLPVPSWQDFTDYELCYWYALEMRRRAQWYAALFDRIGVSYTTFEFADLRSVTSVVQMISACGLTVAPVAHQQIAKILAEPMNAKTHDKTGRGRGNETADPRFLQHAEAFVVRACKAGTADDYLPRLRVVHPKAA